LANIVHYNDQRFIRELANRFKHSGGFPDDNFIKKYGRIIGVDWEKYTKALKKSIEIQIPYSKLCWKCYIKQTEEFLLDCVNVLHQSKINQ
jgi:hypothetical protein